MVVFSGSLCRQVRVILVAFGTFWLHGVAVTDQQLLKPWQRIDIVCNLLLNRIHRTVGTVWCSCIYYSDLKMNIINLTDVHIMLWDICATG